MSKKQDAFYFENFAACAGFACEAAELLLAVLEDFDPSALEKRLEEMHRIEHAADGRKHELLSVLTRAFITPIEREDILTLSQNIDEVVDQIEDVLLRIYCNNVCTVREDALPFAKMIIHCCEELYRLLEAIADFRKSSRLHDYIVRINTLEEEADRLFIGSMRRLHECCADDPVAVITWREVYIYLEKCADACEHAADTVESIVMKNS